VVDLPHSFHYCAAHLAEIADNARDVDLAIRWGFGWNQGPFEIWQEAGWQPVAKWIAEDIAAGKAMASVPLPSWAVEPARNGVHGPQGSYMPAENRYQPRPSLPFTGQPFPDRLLGEEANAAPPYSRPTACAAGTRRRHRDRQLQEQDARYRR
jgi:3-hydroxyacyl-CoA dehydrogenase